MTVREIVKDDARFTVDDGPDGRYAAFWDWYASPTWEPDTVAAYRACVHPGTRVLDIGGWIGPTTLLAAALGADVVAIEPDPVAATALRRNLELNPDLAARVTVLELAVAERDGVVALESEAEGGDSLSHLRLTKQAVATSWEVRAVTMSTLLELPEVGEPSFVKLDAEGAEYVAVPEAAEYLRTRRPSVYLSTHPNLLYDRSSLATRVVSALAATRANRRLLAALATYRYHYVEQDGSFRDVRIRNRLRALAPIPLRAAFLIGSCLFTDRPLER